MAENYLLPIPVSTHLTPGIVEAQRLVINPVGDPLGL